MNDTVTLDPQGRIDIPETIREALHLQSGQRFVIVTHDDSITLVPERSIAWARGILKGADPANHRDRESTADDPS
ncbi:MAG TPA: AbrB/MazE/SpoVT family DNA-binding domain-containing protein [Plasticicumulans sp.]|nr:AbrB/MazE/SpoVT family DNA-binding domain-containing protein [Plasticicumulans sp.]HMX53813.1 AbrB/MazE/SpoVT family DNA-binding domain-containing protein [Plasticicumulans sp.]HNF64811.1 AbrB/MazE/SpoVT family DNA-binding domain-containing protein [Plasticicumulans sp.]